MAGDVGKIRIRVPSNVKAGDVVRVRCLVIQIGRASCRERV